MHNGTANWDGHSGVAATVQWEVDFASSPIATKAAEFRIEHDDHAAMAVQNLSGKWNNAHQPTHPAIPKGATVEFRSNSPTDEIVGMRVIVDKQVIKRVPADGTEVEVVPGLYVFRSH